MGSLSGVTGRAPGGPRCLPKRCDQLLYVRYTEAGHHVVSGPGTESAVAAAGNVAEIRGSEQFPELWRQEGQRRLARLAARFIDQCADAGPHRRTPAGAADLLRVTMQNHARACIRISGKAYI